MTARPNNREQLLAAALAYAEGGWPVFPLRPGTKRPAAPNHTAATCDGSDRRCADGHVGWEARATLDSDRITSAWRHRPYGIGIACGPAGLIVVDLDTAKRQQPISGAETLAHLEHHQGETLPATWTVGTPSGGRHLYYLQLPGALLGNTAGRVGPGIDTRGHGGYVVAPPTTAGGDEQGGEYWLVDDHPPVALPDWFGALLAPPARPARIDGAQRRRQVSIATRDRRGDGRLGRYVIAALTAEQERITSAAVGQRNHTLFCAAVAVGQLVGAQALPYDEAEELLLIAAQAHVSAGAYSQTQARQTVASGLRRGTAEPRRLPSDLLVTQGARP